MRKNLRRYLSLALLMLGMMSVNAQETGSWVNLINNSDMEGDDVSSFFTKINLSAPMPSVITDGIGKNGSRGIMVEATARVSDNWDNQFWFRFNEPVPAGTKYRVSFDYKADIAAKAETQAHAEPSYYIHWYMFGDINFETEWKTFTMEGEVTAEQSPADDDQFLSVAFNLNAYEGANTYYFDNIKFEIYLGDGSEPNIPETGSWGNLINNSDMEGDDVSSFFTKISQGAPEPSVITDGIGVDGSRGIMVAATEKVGEAWDNQFWFRFNEPVPAGTKYRVSFDYRADIAAATQTQVHAEPSDYVHWNMFGDIDFETEWKTFTKEGEVTADQSPADHQFLSVAFNLNAYEGANNYYFDNIKFEIYKLDLPTGINTVGTQAKSGVIYNLQGQKVTAPKAGLYIIDGKKVILK